MNRIALIGSHSQACCSGSTASVNSPQTISSHRGGRTQARWPSMTRKRMTAGLQPFSEQSHVQSSSICRAQHPGKKLRKVASFPAKCRDEPLRDAVLARKMKCYTDARPKSCSSKLGDRELGVFLGGLYKSAPLRASQCTIPKSPSCRLPKDYKCDANGERPRQSRPLISRKPASNSISANSGLR